MKFTLKIRTNADDTANYENHPITRQGELLNLTQMWVANHRPKNQDPPQWLRLPSTEHFLRRLESVLGISHDTLVVTERGRSNDHDSGTWAHWQLALVYAHYLDPGFYIWCNELVHNSMQCFGGPPAKPTKPMVTLLEDAFGRLHRRLDVLGQYACDNLLLTIAHQQLLPGKRLEFGERAKRIICAVVAREPFEGQCPCCSRAAVLSPDGTQIEGAEFDHFYGPGLNRPEYGWLICKRCHDDFNASPLLRLGLIPVFHQFQSQVLDYLLTNRSASPTNE